MRSALLALLAALGVAAQAAAADFPTHPLKWVVPYPPGGSTDLLARLFAPVIAERIGQTILVENKPGGGNNIAVEYVVKSDPDGYTLLLVNPANGINTTLYKHLPFNFLTDIAPVAGLARSPNVMVVRPNFPAKTVAEFIDYCKKNPGKINMASSGSGTSVHLSGELFKSMTGCNMLHVPYKGAGPALADIMGGQADLIFDNLPSSIGHVKGGRLRALGVTSAQRDPSYPDIPAIGETVKGYEATAWFGIGTTKGAPREAILKLNEAANAALKDERILKRLRELGGTPLPGTPEDFGNVIKAETEKWAPVVKASGAKVE
jgi:tripartite-type tricarboxylate transporter receptor subunit TctC